MREFLLSSCPVILWTVTALHLLFACLAFGGWKKTKNILWLLTGFITVGLFYDALILSLGSVLDGGDLLKTLSRLRFVFHGALIPLIFPMCAYALGFNKFWKTLVWILTAVLMVLGIAEGFSVELTLQNVAGIARYTSGDGTPAWAQAVSGILSYGTVVPLILAGIIVWIKQKTERLFLSGFFMFLFSALGPATGNFDLIFLISMFGEVLMVLFFLLYAKKRSGAA